MGERGWVTLFTLANFPLTIIQDGGQTFHDDINLEPRVSLALCQRFVAGRNSGILENFFIFLIGCLQSKNQSKNSKNIQRNSIIPESLQATNR